MVSKIKIRFLFILLGLLLINLQLKGQESASPENKEIYLAFDEAIGSVNTEIYSGAEYIEKHRMINERHKFFESNTFVPGTVYYGEQPFFNIPLKYNIFDDVVIVNPQEGRGQSGFRLFENKLQGFEVHGRKFTNISSPDADLKGIYEVLFEDEQLRLLKKYRLRIKEIRRDAFVHFEFRPRNPEYYFFHDGVYREVSRRNLLEAFPDQRSIVRDNFRKFRRQSGERRDESAIVLFQTLSTSNN